MVCCEVDKTESEMSVRSQWGMMGKLMLTPLVTPGIYSARRYPGSPLGSQLRPDSSVLTGCSTALRSFQNCCAAIQLHCSPHVKRV